MADIGAAQDAYTGHRKLLFLSALLLLTTATVVIYPLLGNYLLTKDARSSFIFLALGWLSTAHVATTAFFYADKEFLPHAASRPIRYIYAPIGVVVASIVVWGLTHESVGRWYAWQLYHGWLLWHYMRQNIGVTALAAQSVSENRLTSLERAAITATSIAGILGAMKFAPQSPLSDAHELLLVQVGLAIYVGAALTTAYCIWQRLATSSGWVTPVFLVAVTAFFAPTFFSDKYILAVTGYAVAHALQYWFLMSLVAIGSGRTSGYVRSILSFIGLTVAIWGLIYMSRQQDIWASYAGWAAGFGIGVTIAHFIVDADAWRLREKFQRGYVMSRLKPFMN